MAQAYFLEEVPKRLAITLGMIKAQLHSAEGGNVQRHISSQLTSSQRHDTGSTHLSSRGRFTDEGQNSRNAALRLQAG